MALAAARSPPSATVIRRAHTARRAGRAGPALMVTLYPGPTGVRASVCGPAGDVPPVLADRDPPHMERVGDLALAEPAHHAASLRLLFVAYVEEEDLLPYLTDSLDEVQSLKRPAIDTTRRKLAQSGLRQPVHEEVGQAMTWGLDNNSRSRENDGRIRLAVPKPTGLAGGTRHMRPVRTSMFLFQVGVASVQEPTRLRRATQPVSPRKDQ